jgi:arylsulfatase A-like enzyme
MLSLLMSLSLLMGVDEPKRPNIVFLLGDDWRWDTLRCAGNPVVATPHLDALAKDGLRFTQMRVTTSICMVSRASLLSGQHMARHGIRAFGVSFSEEAMKQTWPALLREAGYHTGYVGKYGVGNNTGKAFDYVQFCQLRHWVKDAKGEKLHVTEKNSRDALRFLGERPKDKPFALSVGFFAPHADDPAPTQYLPQPHSAKWYESAKIPIPKTASKEHLAQLPAFLSSDENEGRRRWKLRFDTPEKYQTSMINYYRLVSEVDEVIGRLVAELKKQGVYENTLILFTGDNGYFHGERGLADKWYPYEEALRVPLIVHDPRIPAKARGTTREQLVLNIDVAPTILKAAGVNVPKSMQGVDLAPCYTAEKPIPWREEFYYEHPTLKNKTFIPSSEALASLTSKFINWPEWEQEELYDLTKDRLEEQNRAREAKDLARWRERLDQLRKAAR